MKAKFRNDLRRGNDGGGGGGTYGYSSSSRYLKPGALAQLRNSKVRVKSRISLYYELIVSAATEQASYPPPPTPPQAEDTPAVRTYGESVPCFDLRTFHRPRCLMRKKLVATSPIFAGSQS